MDGSTTAIISGSSPTLPGCGRRKTNRGSNAPCNTCAVTSGPVNHSPASRKRRRQWSAGAPAPQGFAAAAVDRIELVGASGHRTGEVLLPRHPGHDSPPVSLPVAAVPTNRPRRSPRTQDRLRLAGCHLAHREVNLARAEHRHLRRTNTRAAHCRGRGSAVSTTSKDWSAATEPNESNRHARSHSISTSSPSPRSPRC